MNKLLLWIMPLGTGLTAVTIYLNQPLLETVRQQFTCSLLVLGIFASAAQDFVPLAAGLAPEFVFFSLKSFVGTLFFSAHGWPGVIYLALVFRVLAFLTHFLLSSHYKKLCLLPN